MDGEWTRSLNKSEWARTFVRLNTRPWRRSSEACRQSGTDLLLEAGLALERVASKVVSFAGFAGGHFAFLEKRAPHFEGG